MSTRVESTVSDLLVEYMSKEQIAKVFEVSERTVERWVRLRLFPAPLRLGRKRLYHLPTIRRYLADQTGGQSCGRR